MRLPEGAPANLLIGGRLDSHGLPIPLGADSPCIGRATNLVSCFSNKAGYDRSFTTMYIRWNGAGGTELPDAVKIKLQAVKMAASGSPGKGEATEVREFAITFQHNGKTTLQEVLDGTKVFVYDTDEKHKGAYDAINNRKDEEKQFYFVQELLNQVVPRMRKFRDASSNPIPNSYQLIEENGIFSEATSTGLEQFKLNFLLAGRNSDNERTGNYTANFSVSPTGVVSYDKPDDDTTDTFRKLMKDYNHLGSVQASKDWLHKIVDKALLVGAKERIPNWLTRLVLDADAQINGSNNPRNDTGLYELYKNVVEKFVDKMIKEAERYTGTRHNLLEEIPTDRWTSRKSVKVNNVWLGYGPSGCSATTNPPCAGLHGSGMSYCFGCNSDVSTFNALVSKWPGPPRNEVPGDYNGNINEITGQPDETFLIDLEGNILGPNGTKQWPGLYETREQKEWTAYFENKSNACDVTTGISQRQHRLYPQKWAGIDCSAFVQRVVNAADPEVNTGLASELPGVKTTIFDLASYAENCATRKLDNRAYVGYYFDKETLTDAKNRTYYVPMDTEDVRQKMTPKLRKGDLIRYEGHVSIVYSVRPTDDNAYEIIHAYGGDCTEYNRVTGGCKQGAFSRKVVVTPEQFERFPKPTGLGRIKLWD